MKHLWLLTFIALSILLINSCGHQQENANISPYEIEVMGDTLHINSLKYGSQAISYSISDKPFHSKWFTNSIKLDMLELVKDDVENVYEYAYTIATNGKLPIRFNIDNQLDTTIFIPFLLPSSNYTPKTKILSGPCLKLGLKGVSSSQESEIKKWLFNRETYADDAVIHRMSHIINYLTSCGH